MKTNPEFQRNLWLELTQHRLIGMPAVLAAIFFLTYLIDSEDYISHFQTVAQLLYVLLILFWGTRLAGDSIIDEIKDHTWDQQRMTSISPWSMSWGKLFGSTIYTWYGGAICLLVYIFGALQLQQAAAFKHALLLICAGVFGQSVALLASLQAIEKKRQYSRSTSTAFMVLGLLAAIPIINYGFNAREAVEWYDLRFDALNFLLISLLCFCAWGLLAIQRKMREELQFRNLPFAWLGFCVFLSVFIAGLVDNSHISNNQLTTVRLFAAYTLLIALSYTMIFLEDKNPLLIRRAIIASAERNWRAVLEQIPCWLVTLAVLIVLCVLLLFQDYPLLNTFRWHIEFKPYIVSMTVFLCRDILLFLFFNMGAKRQRADLAAVLYLAVLYWLLFSIFGLLHLPALNAMFMPIASGYPSVTLISGAVQAAILLVLTLKRWRTNFAEPKAQMTPAS